MYDPIFEEEVLGRAEVRKVYRISGVGAICGSYVTNGLVNRQASVRIVRDGIDIYEGKIRSLKRFKDDIREVHQGYECGISVENFNDIKDGDILEFFRMKEVEREL
jgi:translation initiation factor IF-2